jgi:hypothetical protein
VHQPGIGLDVHDRDRSGLHAALREEPDPPAARLHGPDLPVGDHLELLWLLVCGPVQRRGAQQTHVVLAVGERHQVADVPVRRCSPGLAVFDGYDDEEAATGDGQAALGDQPLDRLREGNIGDPERLLRR